MYKLKYPLKLSDRLLPKGYCVQLATIDEARQQLPKIKLNEESTYTAVKYDEHKPPIVVCRKQLVLSNGPIAQRKSSGLISR